MDIEGSEWNVFIQMDMDYVFGSGQGERLAADRFLCVGFGFF